MSKKKKLEEVLEKEEPSLVEEGDHEGAYVSLRHIDKVYDNNVQAVFDFNLDIKKHEFIVFVGPSGCGKSTTLRMIAGLEDITRGELYIDGEYSNDRTPKDRDIAMVFQSYALYPHMTVYNNMAFGLKIRHLPKEEIKERVTEAAKILQIEEYLDRKPKALSGGQRQRVALGRAIVRNAKVFLMDEPLSNLDAKLRVQMRSEIVRLHESLGATTIYVTHDQTEAMTMASRIVVMKGGYIQQIGTPIEIYDHPSNLFVATFIGSPAMNILEGEYEDGKIYLNGGKVEIALPRGTKTAHDTFYKEQIELANAKLAKLEEELSAKEKWDQALADKVENTKNEIASYEEALKGRHKVAYGIRPEDIHDVKEDKEGLTSPVELTVNVAELLGHEYYIHTDFGGVDMVAKIPLSTPIHNGDKISLAFDSKKAHIFDLTSTKRIF